MTCEQTLTEAAARIGGDSPRLDAELLLAEVTRWSRTRFRAFPGQAVEPEHRQQFEQSVARRSAGEPVAHILGWQGFWTLTLAVTPETLIPRPDTERLVETALELDLPPEAKVLDLGTGTGAIALALLSERPAWSVTATDVIPAAVALARRNADHCDLPLTVIQSNWFDSLPDQRFDLIVSNPPYIEGSDWHLDQGDVRFEPATALVSGDDGLDAIRHLVRESQHWLTAGGWLMLEHGYNQGPAVRELFEKSGYTVVETCKDYGGNDRLTLGRHV